MNTNNNPTLWIEDGTAVGQIGAGNIANSAPASGGLGGGIYNLKNLNISDSSIEGNTGDGIYNHGGEIRILDSSVSANTLSGIESFISGATVDIIVERSKIVRERLLRYRRDQRRPFDHPGIDPRQRLERHPDERRIADDGPQRGCRESNPSATAAGLPCTTSGFPELKIRPYPETWPQPPGAGSTSGGWRWAAI